MIKTRKDLKLYLHEDAKANHMNGVNYLQYLIKLFAGSESAHSWRYIKCLRHCEYHLNNKGLLHKIQHVYYKVKLHRLGGVGIILGNHGVSLIHFAGGGGCLVNAKKIGETMSHSDLVRKFLVGSQLAIMFSSELTQWLQKIRQTTL